MRKNILLALLLTISSITFGQTIKIDTNGLFVNSNKITELTTPEYLESILGKPDNKYLKLNTIWTYDNLGLMIYINPADSKLKSISIDFKKKKFDFSPKKIFSGKFIIYGNHVSENTPIVSLKKMNELTFEQTPFQVYSASTSYLTLIFEYLDNINKLEGVGISFK